MKINDVPNDILMIKNGDTLPIEDLRAEWDSMTLEEKEGWYTTVCKRSKVDADWVIGRIIEDLACDGYEEMDTMLADQLPTDGTAKLQEVLDYLFDNSAADVYYPAEKIEVER